MSRSFKKQAIFDLVELILSEGTQVNESPELVTTDMGALIRDKGKHVALGAGDLRRRFGQLSELSNCAEYVLPKYRRKLKK
tara:strand:+ start:6846 stop:7088 length:243 start_codon:yes stop_codon:yes gene_type:complete